MYFFRVYIFFYCGTCDSDSNDYDCEDDDEDWVERHCNQRRANNDDEMSCKLDISLTYGKLGIFAHREPFNLKIPNFCLGKTN